MKILIATGIYPPEIGGPAEYAANLASVWQTKGNKVEVAVFSKWHFLPTGVRHAMYFFSIIPKVIRADSVVILDTFSAALPALVASMLFGKKTLLRTGGDFLWEWYVERTGDQVLLSDFYKTSLSKLNLKEKVTFKIIGFILRNVDILVFSTSFQESIFWYPYKLQNRKTFVIENFFGGKKESNTPTRKNFIGGTRSLKWKNLNLLKEVFTQNDLVSSSATLDLSTGNHAAFQEKIKNCYAVVLASLGDISPNMILDAIAHNKPFIVTKETGIADRIKDIAVFVDPKNKADIKEKVFWLCEKQNYAVQKKKIENFTFTHSWEEMADEYLNLLNT